MKKTELLKTQEILKQQLAEARNEFENTEKERENLWEQYRNATSEEAKRNLEETNKELDKKYYALSDATHRLPTILSSLEYIITGKIVSPFDF